MNTRVWNCPACQCPNTSDSSFCRSCGSPAKIDSAAADRTQAKVIYFFQAILLVFAVVAIARCQTRIIGSTLIVACTWWAGLTIFAGAVVGGEFRPERAYAKSVIEARHTTQGKLAAQAAFFILYWPILIPKQVYFWALIGAGSVYYALKFLPNQ